MNRIFPHQELLDELRLLSDRAVEQDIFQRVFPDLKEIRIMIEKRDSETSIRKKMAALKKGIERKRKMETWRQPIEN